MCIPSLAVLIVLTTAEPRDQTLGRPAGIRAITPFLRVDHDNRWVTLDAQVVFRDGPLELLLCPRKTKEHEAILAAEVEPRMFQLALLMVGALPGSPARVVEVPGDGVPMRRLIPPTGQTVKIWLEYQEDKLFRRVDARNWIRDQTRQPLSAEFVFAGSGFAVFPGVDRPVFLANDGDLVCVVNFKGSVIDVAQPSSDANSERLFEAWTEKIPPIGTKVRVVFEPLFE